MSTKTRRKEYDMRRLSKLAAVVTALGALAFGGSALAGAAGKANPPSPPAATQPRAPVAQPKAPAVAPPQDGDTVQQGDQSSPDTGSPAETAGEASAASEASSESGSEVANNDGPGGHADEPGNPAADNQFQGEQ
jgi:hypothetical protein